MMRHLAFTAVWVLCLVQTGIWSHRAFAEDWPKYMHDLANSGHSGETGISSSNAASLKTKWTFQAGTFKISGSPSVATVHGVSRLYIGSWSGVFYALNAVSGKQIWSFQVDLVGRCNAAKGCRIGSSAQVDPTNNLVFFGAANGYLYALNASNGKLVWKKLLGKSNDGYEIWSSPVLYNGNIYVGVASGGDDPCVVGRVDTYNELDGTPVWSFSTLDQSTCPQGTCVGAAVWSTVAIDTSNGIVYASTGNPGASCAPASKNAALYPDSVIALSASTGALLNYFQAKSDDDNDDDFGASPVLHMTGEDNECKGTEDTEYWVTAMNKYGGVYVLGRDQNGLNGVVKKPKSPTGFIATAAVLPQTVVTTCGKNKHDTKYTNNLYVPGRKGDFLNYFQNHTGAMTLKLNNSLGDDPLMGAPSVIQDVVFFGGNNSELNVAKSDGTTLAQFPVGAPIFGGVAISNSRVYFGATNGTVYCMSVNGQ
jgi:quinohemoprotein ethanol dehydrogenase